MFHHPHISLMVSPMHSPCPTNTQPLSCQRVNCVLAPVSAHSLLHSGNGWVMICSMHPMSGQSVHQFTNHNLLTAILTQTQTQTQTQAQAQAQAQTQAQAQAQAQAQRACMTGRCAYSHTSAGSTALSASWSSSASEPGCCFCCCSARWTAHAFFTSTRLHYLMASTFCFCLVALVVLVV